MADKAVLTFLSTSDATLSLDGKGLAASNADGYSTYKAEIDVSTVKTSELKVFTETEAVEVTIALGYKNESISVQSVKNMFSSSLMDNSAAIDDGVYRYTLSADTSGATRAFDLNFSDYGIDNMNGELWMTMYNYGTKNVTFNLYASHSDNQKFKEFTSRYGIHGSSITSITLKPGENLVKIPTFIMLWNMKKQRVHGRYGTLLALRFEATTDEEIKLGFGQFTIER